MGPECPNKENLRLGRNNLYRAEIIKAGERVGLIPQAIAALSDAGSTDYRYHLMYLMHHEGAGPLVISNKLSHLPKGKFATVEARIRDTFVKQVGEAAVRKEIESKNGDVAKHIANGSQITLIQKLTCNVFLAM